MGKWKKKKIYYWMSVSADTGMYGQLYLNRVKFGLGAANAFHSHHGCAMQCTYGLQASVHCVVTGTHFKENYCRALRYTANAKYSHLQND